MGTQGVLMTAVYNRQCSLCYVTTPAFSLTFKTILWDIWWFDDLMIKRVNWPRSQAWSPKNQSPVLNPDLLLKTICFSTYGNVLTWRMLVLWQSKQRFSFCFAFPLPFLQEKKTCHLLDRNFEKVIRYQNLGTGGH